MERPNILYGDERIRIDLVNLLPDRIDIPAQDAAADQTDRPILATRRELGRGVALVANGFGDCAAPTGADNLQVAMPDGEMLLDRHSDDISSGKTSGVSDDVPQVIQITQDACDGNNPYKRLEETQDPC